MPYLLDISTAVPEYQVSNHDVEKFYSSVLNEEDQTLLRQKLPRLIEKSQIKTRYSCIPDFTEKTRELFRGDYYHALVDDRLALYRQKIEPLAIRAIDKLFIQTGTTPLDISHIITVSCTGLMAPGLEITLAEHYKIPHIEKHALNFLGCYAALKAIKLANYIAQDDAHANILIVCAELCSLHFSPSTQMEDVISNLLFADGAAAMLICGDKSPQVRNNTMLHIDYTGSACIPETTHLMTWNVTSTAFKMHLGKQIANVIRENIRSVIYSFSGELNFNNRYWWAIHPGGIRIVHAVQEGLGLDENSVADSLQVLEQYGNMSSPTVLFILKNICNKIKMNTSAVNKNIFACAFGPGLNIELVHFTPVDKSLSKKLNFYSDRYAIPIEI